MSKKILSVLLALMMVLSTLSATSMMSFADITNVDGDDDSEYSASIPNIDGEDDDIQDEINGLIALIDKYSENTVKATDEKSIDDIKEEAESFASTVDSLTDNQKNQINSVVSKANSLKDKIAQVDKAVKDASAKADAINTVDEKNIDNAKNVIAEIDKLLATDNLTEEQIATLTSKKASVQAAIDKFMSAQPTTPSKPENPTQPSTTPDKPESPTQPSATEPSKTDDAAFATGLKVTNKGANISVKWNKVDSADGYLVYAQYCGKKFNKKATKNVKSSKTALTLKKLNGKAIDQKKNVKLYVVAYKVVDGKKVVIGKTIVAHIVGSKNKKYTNVKSLSVSKSNVTLNEGATSKINAKVKLVDKKKKHLKTSHTKKFRYISSDTKVATVTADGKIKAVGKGNCKVYVYSINGISKTVKVTVK